MDTLKCPHCGRENNPDSSFCSNCRAVLGANADLEHAPATYPQPLQARKGLAGLSRGKKIGITLAVLLALTVVGYTAFRLIKTVTYPDLKLDAPPAGFEQVTGAQFKEIERQFESEEEGASLDAFYCTSDGSNQIFIMHVLAEEITLISIGGGDTPPETGDLQEMKEYINSNRSAMEDELEKEYGRISAEAENLLIDAVKLEKAGYCGIHVCVSVKYGERTILQDRIILYRDGVTYVAAIQDMNGESNDEGLQHLMENLYFE
ncbi:MAG: zinc ribbon domain-containing protein [Actinobacteria bacterium]|jgi:hypothetical protein|nr:MAG: zinc ribbon domain-containing protein [Actinomycetota bacterium]